jgi:hypothetical protein
VCACPPGFSSEPCLCGCDFVFAFLSFPFWFRGVLCAVVVVGVRFSCSDLFFDVSEDVPSKEFIYLLTRLKIWQVLCSFSFLGEFLERSEISLFSLGQVRNFLGGIGHLHANFIWL